MAKRQSGDQAFVATSSKGTTQEQTFAGALSFLRRRYSKDLTDVDLAVMGVPFDLATTNRPGARFGPQAVRAASAIMAWARPYGLSFDPRDVLSIIDTGDCVFDPFHPASVPAAIEAAAGRVVVDLPDGSEGRVVSLSVMPSSWATKSPASKDGSVLTSKS